MLLFASPSFSPVCIPLPLRPVLSVIEFDGLAPVKIADGAPFEGEFVP